MNINYILEKEFKNFKFNNELIPISPNIYSGEATTYLVYYTYSTRPEIFADDLSICEGTYGTIDIFSNKNYKKLKNEVKKRIVKNCGFTWIEDGLEDFEEETGLWHVPISFYVESQTSFLD